MVLARPVALSATRAPVERLWARPRPHSCFLLHVQATADGAGAAICQLLCKIAPTERRWLLLTV